MDPRNTGVGAGAVCKIFLRLVPFAMLLLFCNLVDRTNISFAALQMNHDLGFTPTVYGIAAGIFFLGYCIFEIPSNLLLVRVGARRWLARIILSWGAVVLAMVWVAGPHSFYIARFLLGVSEAGLLPGLLYYLAAWVPARERGLAYAALMSTTALSNILGGPLTTGLMQFEGLWRLHGWQIMFIFEGFATLLLGLAVLRYLPETPQDVSWLDAAEKRWVVDQATADLASQEHAGVTSLWITVSDPRVLRATVFSFFMVCCNFGTVFWLPQIVKSLGGMTNLAVGMLSAVPYSLGGVAMLAWGRHSDTSNDRKWHLIFGAMIGASGYACAGMSHGAPASFAGLCLATLGIWSMFGVFWAYVGDLLGGRAAAGGLAFINSVSSLGGLVGPLMIGVLRDRTHSFSASLLTLAGLATVTAALGLLLNNPVRRRAPAGQVSRMS